MLDEEAILSGPSTPLGTGVVRPGEAGLLVYGDLNGSLGDSIPLLCEPCSRSCSRPLPLPPSLIEEVGALEK